MTLPEREALDDHTLRIRLKGKYPQFKYWLSMTFFAPIPWEADAFYAQAGLAGKNLSLNFWPVGTGPYMLVEYQENRRHVLERNPNFRGEPYPCEGEDGRQGGRPAGRLRQADPVHRPHRDRDREGKNSAEDQVSAGVLRHPGDLSVRHGCSTSTTTSRTRRKSRRLFRERGVQMPRTLEISNWYVGFNWLDPVVGKGDTPEQQIAQSQAAPGAVDRDRLGRVRARVRKQGGGRAGNGPGAAGRVRLSQGSDQPRRLRRRRRQAAPQVDRRCEEAARRGRLPRRPRRQDRRTAGAELRLSACADARAEGRSRVDGASSSPRSACSSRSAPPTYNRFQEKAEKGSLQIFWWGWFADYPDAENFLFLLYGPNSKALTGGNGENSSNYKNEEFDKLFEELKFLDDVPRKQQVIDRMVAITQEDAAWAFGYNPYAGTVHQQWVGNVKPGPLVNDRLMYMKVDPALRATKIAEWNQPDLVADRRDRAGADGGRDSGVPDLEAARARERGALAWPIGGAE